jgi:heme-degrading monooxygenase HmoA
MFLVIFEVQPKPERRDDYLALAGVLKPKVEAIDGFIDVERFASKRAEGRLLSLSTWRDEEAVIRWRTHAEHQRAQQKGRREIFQDYRLRVGEVTADMQPNGLRSERQRFDDTESSGTKIATVTEAMLRDSGGAGAKPDLSSLLGLDNNVDGLVDQEAFESIYTAGKFVLLASWRHADGAKGWIPPMQEGRAIRHRRVRIVRDYGLVERTEAPQ